MEDNETDNADNADAGRVVNMKGGMQKEIGKAYARPTVKIPVRTSFCGWLALRRQRIGIGYKECPAISLLRVDIKFTAFFTYQSQKCKVRSGVDPPRYEEI